MSFSSKVKEDLVRIKLKPSAQRLCELSGLTLTCGALHVGRNGTGALYTTESLAVGRRIIALSESLYTLTSTMELSKQQHRSSPLALVTLSGADAGKLLTETGMLELGDGGFSLSDGVPEALTRSDSGARTFLRGTFLGSGSCLNPARGYHLELVLRTGQLAADVIRLIGRFDVVAKQHMRKGRYVVYMKGDGVADFLALVGASAAAMAFFNVRAEKEVRNYINRASNCETANIGKTVDAALLQTRAIERIENSIGLERLPMPLYEAAMLRLNSPDATLQELADMAEIGKSGMNHRLTRILRMAEEIEDD